MVDLGSLGQSPQSWTLEEFVEVANHHLEQVLSQLNQEDAKKRFREPVTTRLVRYYGSLSVIDKPEKIGREVRYGYRQLLQVLTVRFLLQHGHKIQSIHGFVSSSPNEDLYKLVMGESELVIQAEEKSKNSNFALDMAVSGLAGGMLGYPLSKRGTQNKTTWVEVNVRPGLKLLISANFEYPNDESDFFMLIEDVFRALFDEK